MLRMRGIDGVPTISSLTSWAGVRQRLVPSICYDEPHAWCVQSERCQLTRPYSQARGLPSLPAVPALGLPNMPEIELPATAEGLLTPMPAPKPQARSLQMHSN